MKIFRVLAASVFALPMISGCSATVALEPAVDSNNPKCADVSVRLPDTIDTLERRGTNAQATGAWGTPTAVILRCGLPPADVSTLKCVTAGGVDWLVDDSKSPSYRFISFGRNPATEVIVDSTKIAGVTALETLGGAVKFIPATKKCLG